MDNNILIAIILVIGLFILLVIGFLAKFRRRAKAEIRGPLNLSLKVEGSDEESNISPGIKIEDANSLEGGLLADDSTGRGVDVKKVKTRDDILITSSNQQPPHPKA